MTQEIGIFIGVISLILTIPLAYAAQTLVSLDESS